MDSNEQTLVASAGPDRVARSARFHSRLHRFQTLLRRLWWVPTLTLLVGLAVRTVLLWYAPSNYTAVGQMIVSPKLSIPEGSIYTEELSNFLGTQVALMQSGAVRSRAANWLATNRPELLPTDVELQVSVIPKTTIFVLRATGNDADYTQAYLDACMNAYIDLKRELRSETSETTLAGITQELGRMERELRRIDDELATFLASNSVVLLQEQGISASTYLADLNRQLADLRTEHQLLGALTLEQNLERRPFTAAGTRPNDVLSGDTEFLKARQEVQMLKAEAQELSEFLRPKHPKIVAIQEDIARRERLLDYYLEQSREQLESRRSSIGLQIQNLQELVTEWEARSLDASRKMGDYQKIQASKQRIQSLYDRLLATMQTVDVNKDISPESVTIMETASPAFIARGNLLKEFVVAGLLGLLAGLGVLLLVDRLDDRITSLTEFEDQFEEPVVGQIPKDAEALKNGTALLIKHGDQRHSLIEAFRNLRSALLFLPGRDRKPQVLLVTSSIPGDGKSLTAANLAIALAHGGARVLLVDGDLRKGLLHERFGVEMQGGLSEALANRTPWTALVKPTSYANLSLLPRGRTNLQSSELFISPAITDFLNEARQAYEHVILDTPPVMAADDVASLAPRTDGTVFVLRISQTSGRVARAALELLYQRGVNVVGVVLNAVDTSGGDYHYYKYKDYYSAYPAK
jgi:capsular exopolysaccharide synthesis family protein